MERGGVLIVSASTGTGHLRAAEALREAFVARDPAREVHHVDLLATAPRGVRAVYGTGYEMVAERAPALWGRVYRATDGATADLARWGPAANRLLFRDFRRLLLARAWNVCVTTHFLPGQLAAGRPGLPPFAMVVTDFTLHRFWVQPRVRRVFVATGAMAAELRVRVPGVRVDATGIPVAPAFAAAPPRDEARRTLGLDPERRVALVMGGGLGLGVEEAALAALDAAPGDVQVVAVCGRNEAARARLASLALAPGRLAVHGFAQGMERFLAAADVVATKPGGLTTSEALALGRPLVLTRAIPGAEDGNLRALTDAGAALSGQDAASLREAFRRAFGTPGVLEALSAAARGLGRADAAADVAARVDREYGDERLL
jgi:processive 1,2-diacylglycerol beta-glucosyltransferase